jgi:hypothetical protein
LHKRNPKDPENMFFPLRPEPKYLRTSWQPDMHAWSISQELSEKKGRTTLCFVEFAMAPWAITYRLVFERLCCALRFVGGQKRSRCAGWTFAVASPSFSERTFFEEDSESAHSGRQSLPRRVTISRCTSLKTVVFLTRIFHQPTYLVLFPSQHLGPYVAFASVFLALPANPAPTSKPWL